MQGGREKEGKLVKVIIECYLFTSKYEIICTLFPKVTFLTGFRDLYILALDSLVCFKN